jgi:hypothetical protein
MTRTIYEVTAEKGDKTHTVFFSSVSAARDFASACRHRGWKAQMLKSGDVFTNVTDALHETIAMLEHHR